MHENAAMQPAEDQKMIQRELPEPQEARAHLVSAWQKKVQHARAFFDSDFKRMRRDMELAKLGADGQWKKSGKYTTNIIQREINQKVSALYAKNPRVIARRTKRMDFKLWDGNPQTLAAVQQMVAIDPYNQDAMAVVQDVMDGMQRRKMFDKIGKTLEYLFHHFMAEQSQNFKKQAKQAVRRACVTGIAYCEVGFQRQFDKDPSITSKISDVTEQLMRMQSLMADLSDGEMQPDAAEMEELKIMLRSLQDQEEILVREGLTFDWPRAHEIVIDPNCRQINGFLGADWIARRFRLTPKQIQEVYGKDIRSAATGQQSSGDMPAKLNMNTQDGSAVNEAGQPANSFMKANVYKVWQKSTRTCFTICEGYPDFLVEPAAPPINIERFWPVFSIEFNPIEDDQDETGETRIYGLSEVELMADPQKEYNRARQGLREHREASRPGYVTAKGKLEEADKVALSHHEAHEVVELNALVPGEKIADVMQSMPKQGIDPGLYDPTPAFEDVQRQTGFQEANFGGTSKATATEVSTASSSLAGPTDSNRDDMNDFLTEIAQTGGQVLLTEMSPQEVQRIVGPGAIWPEFTMQDVVDELYLDIQAGSQGRPNKAQDVAMTERLAPYIVQTPGINPLWFGKKLVEYMDADFELEDAILDGLPSMIAMNALSRGGAAGAAGPSASGEGNGGGAGGSENDPSAQGDRGSMNAPNPQDGPPGPQPAFPSGA